MKGAWLCGAGMLLLAACATQSAAGAETGAGAEAETDSETATETDTDTETAAETDSATQTAAATNSATDTATDTVFGGLECLRRAYPDHVCGLDANALLLCDGTRILYDDGRDKTPAQRLAEPDLEDQMAVRVARGAATGLPPRIGHDPGRARHLPLFEKMYGDNGRAARGRLVEIPWVDGRRVSVTTVNAVDRRLRAVSDALSRLPPATRAIAAQTAGTFNTRDVRGTNRRSAHAFGIAIDVASDHADYWRWGGADRPPRYKNRVPLDIVHAFEREGFLWGGRWYHHDTMHFEYRPELMLQECRAETGAETGAEAEAETGTGTGTGAGTEAGTEAGTGTGAGAGAGAGGGDGLHAWPHGIDAERLAQRFLPPAGFVREPAPTKSFAAWLRQLPLRPGRGRVWLHDGRAKGQQGVHAAVVDIDTGARDLQQCADAVMRLRAEYLFGAGRGDEVCFRAVDGKPLPYLRWRRGERPPRGRAHPWRKQTAADSRHANFRRYLDHVFGIANTASLRRELEPVDDPMQVEPGDVYIQGASGGYFGHAVLVLDVATNPAGDRIFLIAQSYMPAQDIHILKNPNPDALDQTWYRPTRDGSLKTPEWTFPAGALRRFGKSCH